LERASRASADRAWVPQTISDRWLQLIVEVDGLQHADANAATGDEIRTKRLRQDGWIILRFWNDDVIRDIDNVCQHIVIEAGLGGTL
jgi:very-short-patch-repair endonuclease